ncbi:MAG: hypothetical protein A2Y15_04020 [Clostridiales bacterium GWF2_36_10]|nr:MAG: hypothetical protein A2Y15_04020 [Clostridiales bacterium GWF2_36_10]
MKKKSIKKLLLFLLIIAIISSTLSSFSTFNVSALTVTGGTLRGTFYIRNIKSGLYLDVNGGYTASGTNVQIWSENTSNAQKWQIWDLSNGHSIIRTETNLQNALDVNSGYNSNNSNIDVRSVSSYNEIVPSYAQWDLIDNGDGTFRIASVCSGSTKVLDCYYAATSSGTNVVQYTYNGGSNQKWALESISRDIRVMQGSDVEYCKIDSGNHLDIDADDTQYTNELDFAINLWNSYKPGVIRYDNIFIDEDVKMIAKSQLPMLQHLQKG